MRIIARRTLKRFVEARAGQKDQAPLKSALDARFDEVRTAHWTRSAD
jgi:mRNA interferase HigB